MRQRALLLAALLWMQAGPAAAMAAVRLPARIPAASVPAVNPLVSRWSGSLKTAFQAWDVRLGVLPGGALTAGLAVQDFSEPANQRQLIPLLRTLEEMGIPPEALAEHPQGMQEAAAYSQENVRRSVRSKAALLSRAADGSDESYRAAKELLRDVSAYGAYLDARTREAAERSFERAAGIFRDARRAKALRKLRETAAVFNLNLFDPEVMDWVLDETTDSSLLLAASGQGARNPRPFATLPDPVEAKPSASPRRLPLARAPPSGEDVHGRAARVPEPVSDAKLEEAIGEDFKEDNALSEAVRKIEWVSGRFAAEAAGVLFMEAFVQLRGYAIKEAASQFTGLIRSQLDADGYLGALREIRDYADETRENPRARRWVENLARFQARMDYRNFDGSARKIQNIAFVANPLPGGEYWDLAAGPHAAALMRNGLSPDTKYVLLDISPFVVAYLREVRRLLMADGMPYAENIEIVEQDLRELKAPEGKVSVIRGKNIYAYVPGFEKRYEELSRWLAEGGQLVLPMDRSPQARMHLIQAMGDFIERKILEGWGFEFSFAGEPGAHDAGFDHIILTKPKAGERTANSRTFRDFKNEIAPGRGRGVYSLLDLLR